MIRSDWLKLLSDRPDDQPVFADWLADHHPGDWLEGYARNSRLIIRNGVAHVVIAGHGYNTLRVLFSPDGTLIASCGHDCTVRIWDAVSGSMLNVIDRNAQVYALAFSPDGSLIACGGAAYGRQILAVFIYDVRSGKLVSQLDGHDDWIRDIVFSRSGEYIASCSDDATILVWNAQSGCQIVRLSGHEDWVSSIDFSPDGRYLISGGHDHTVLIWDCVAGAPTYSGFAHGGIVRDVAFSPDGLWAVSCGDDRRIIIYDVVRGGNVEVVSSFRADGGAIYSISYSPDGNYLAYGAGWTIAILDARSGLKLCTLGNCRSRVNSLAFSPDGTRIASGSYDGMVRLWDVTLM